MNVPDGFRKLAVESGSAPERLRERLLDQVRRRRRRPAAAFVWWPWAAAAVAMAVFAGLIFAPLKWPKKSVQPLPQQARSEAPPTNHDNVRPDSGGTPVMVSRRRPAPSHRVPARPAPELTPFMALPGSDMMTPVEDARVVRVQIERGMLRELGFVEVEPRDRSPVEADFILGQDGLARAVRLVRY